MTQAQFPSPVAQRLYDLVNDNKTALLTADGQLLYGDQNRIATTPTLCVESGPTGRVLAGVGGNGRTENNHTCWLILYYAKVDTNQDTKKESEQTAEAIAAYLDQNVRLERSGDGGIVIHGYVSNIEPGYRLRNEGKTLMHAVRLTWTGKSKTILGA